MTDKLLEQKIRLALQSATGERLYGDFLRYIGKNHMEKMISSGVAVALSGGADSVFLLSLLWRYCGERGLPLFAISVEHGIRGEESKRDFAFAQALCNTLSVPFIGEEVDAPAYAKENGLGLEESARKIRYDIFDTIIHGRNDISCVALAHNATDQVETVLMHLLRGSGTRGLCGMRPVRGDYIRPILFCSSATIRKFLLDEEIPFCFDSTNDDLSYTRNRIRSILPELSEISSSLEESVSRLSRNLLCDEEYLTETARKVFSGGFCERRMLADLHPSIFFRVIVLMCESVKKDLSYSSASIDAVYSRIRVPGDFCISLEDGLRFVAKGEQCFVEEDVSPEALTFSIDLLPGENRVPGLAGRIVLSPHGTPLPSEELLLSVPIPQSIASAKLTVRSKQEGDSFVFRSHTRKLKKIFCDRHISSDERKRIPIICDEKGILYVPGFGFRDGIPEGERNAYVVSFYGAMGPLPTFLIPESNIRPTVKRQVKKGTD